MWHSSFLRADRSSHMSKWSPVHKFCMYGPQPHYSCRKTGSEGLRAVKSPSFSSQFYALDVLWAKLLCDLFLLLLPVWTLLGGTKVTQWLLGRCLCLSTLCGHVAQEPTQKRPKGILAVPQTKLWVSDWLFQILCPHLWLQAEVLGHNFQPFLRPASPQDWGTHGLQPFHSQSSRPFLCSPYGTSTGTHSAPSTSLQKDLQESSLLMCSCNFTALVPAHRLWLPISPQGSEVLTVVALDGDRGKPNSIHYCIVNGE